MRMPIASLLLLQWRLSDRKDAEADNVRL